MTPKFGLFFAVAFLALEAAPAAAVDHAYKFYSQGSSESFPAGEGDANVNTAKRVEGSFSHNYSGDRLNLRFATDLADVGPGAPVKMKSGL